MKPGDHPDFFRLAPPPGASRESSIRLDADGHFWHDGEQVLHPALAKALHGWIALHPEDHRFILTNGYDWTYFQVDDVPYFVRTLRLIGHSVELELSDDSVEPMNPETLRVGGGDALYTKVKGGNFDARFSRHAQLALAPFLRESESESGSLVLCFGGREHPLPTAQP